MLTIKNRCAVFATAALLLAGCMPPGPRALLEGKRLLERGKYADLILVDRDISKCPVNDVRDTKVLLTMVGGKVVWER